MIHLLFQENHLRTSHTRKSSSGRAEMKEGSMACRKSKPWVAHLSRRRVQQSQNNPARATAVLVYSTLKSNPIGKLLSRTKHICVSICLVFSEIIGRFEKDEWLLSKGTGYQFLFHLTLNNGRKLYEERRKGGKKERRLAIKKTCPGRMWTA